MALVKNGPIKNKQVEPPVRVKVNNSKLKEYETP